MTAHQPDQDGLAQCTFGCPCSIENHPQDMHQRAIRSHGPLRFGATATGAGLAIIFTPRFIEKILMNRSQHGSSRRVKMCPELVCALKGSNPLQELLGFRPIVGNLLFAGHALHFIGLRVANGAD
jgi:hypothetical protein